MRPPSDAGADPVTPVRRITRRRILDLAWPIVLANSATPLLGLVDTAVIGNTGRVQDLGAVGLGALIFSFVFWGFGFLRMGTTGFVAQASGRGDSTEVRAATFRALMLGGVLGSALILLQEPIAWVSLELLGASDDVERVTRGYYDLRIWAAPATLGSYSILGALIGLGRTRSVLAIQLVLNGVNIVLDVLFAGVWGMGAPGIALGTALAEWSAFLFGGVLLWRVLGGERAPGDPWFPTDRIRDGAKARQMFAAHADIMVRTLFLLLGMGWFTNQGAIFGDTILAANHVLLQLISLSAYLLDGYAHATETLVGRSVGAGDADGFDRAVRLSTELAVGTAVGLGLTVFFGGPSVVVLLTDLPEVRAVAGAFLPWAAVYITVSFAAFQLDGIFIGATRTVDLRNASILSCLAFIATSVPAVRMGGNTGLWGAFLAFVVFRAIALGVRLPALRASVDPG